MEENANHGLFNLKKLGLQGQAILIFVGVPQNIGFVADLCNSSIYISFYPYTLWLQHNYHRTISWLNASMCSVRRPINAWTSTSRNYF